MITVQLSEKDLGLLRAGLAAHNISLRHTDPRKSDLMAKANEQRAHGQELSIRLGEAQIAAQNLTKRIIIAIDVPEEDADINDLATRADYYFKNANATVYKCAEDFVADYNEGELK